MCGGNPHHARKMGSRITYIQVGQCQLKELGLFKADREAAYKQLPLEAEYATLGVVALRPTTDNRWYGFVSRAMVFGVVAEVLHYNVFVRLISELFTQMFEPPFRVFSTISGYRARWKRPKHHYGPLPFSSQIWASGLKRRDPRSAARLLPSALKAIYHSSEMDTRSLFAWIARKMRHGLRNCPPLSKMTQSVPTNMQSPSGSWASPGKPLWQIRQGPNEAIISKILRPLLCRGFVHSRPPPLPMVD